MVAVNANRTSTGAAAIGRPIVPKEHGAWAVLYGSFLAGIGVAHRLTVPVLLLLGTVTFLALANGPLTQILKPAKAEVPPDGRRRAVVWLLVYVAGALACVTPLVTLYPMGFLLPFAMVAACVFALRVRSVREGEDRSLWGELIGTAGLTLVGPAAHAVALQGVQPTGAILWLLLFLFFASGVFYVRMRIRVMIAVRKGAAAASGPARWWCLLYHALLLLLVPALLVADLIPWGILLAFAPAIWRAASGLRRRDAIVNLRRLGWSEVGLTLAFILVLIATL